MRTIGAHEAKTHLPRLLERVARGETLTITRHGRPAARLVPVETDDRERAAQAARRLEERRQRLGQATVAELIDSIHDLEVARRRGLPLATLDRRLRDAAVAEGAALFGNAEAAGTVSASR